ncbi:MAG: hypothetical protein WEA84_14745 [Rhodovibrionaceae bacterium]
MQAAAEVRLLLGELRGRDLRQAEALHSQIAQDLAAIQGTLPYNWTPRNTAYDTREDPLFGGLNEDQAVYFAKRAVPAIQESFDRKENEVKHNIQKDSPQWPEFHEDLIEAKASALEHYIFRTIFSHEGGLKPDPKSKGPYPTVAGIQYITLHDLRQNEETRDAIAALGIDERSTPAGLNNAQRIGVMRIYLDDAMRPARTGASRRRGRPVSALDLLAGLQDAESAAALADTFYRSGGPQGSLHVQNAINAFYEERGLPKRIDVDKDFGSETYGAFKAIIEDPRDRKLLLDLLADFRTGEYPDDYRRFDYHRLPQNLPEPITIP